MCIGVPMKILETGFGQAICDDKGEMRTIDTMLIGDQKPGTWVMVFIDAAREVISEQEALRSLNALEALKDVMAGGTDVDHLFADIIASRKAADG